MRMLRYAIGVVLLAAGAVGCSPTAPDLLEQGQVRFEGDSRLRVRPPTVRVNGSSTMVAGTYLIPRGTDRSGHFHIRIVDPQGKVIGESVSPFNSHLNSRSGWRHGEYEAVFPIAVPPGSTVQVQAAWDSH